MTTQAPQRPPWEPPSAGSETDHLLGALDRMRATFRWKADGLDAAALDTRIAASSMTMGGLLKHLALVEDHYFTTRIGGAGYPAPWSDSGAELEADPDWDWHSAGQDSADQLYALYDAACARSRTALAAALADGGLDQPVDLGWSDGNRPSLRRLLCDLLEEYGRHTGHADLIREAIDGRVGEDPPVDWSWPARPTTER